jgi:hypothetical protein
MRRLEAVKGFRGYEFMPSSRSGLVRQPLLGLGEHLYDQETSIHNENTAPTVSTGYR